MPYLKTMNKIQLFSISFFFRETRRNTTCRLDSEIPEAYSQTGIFRFFYKNIHQNIARDRTFFGKSMYGLGLIQNLSQVHFGISMLKFSMQETYNKKDIQTNGSENTLTYFSPMNSQVNSAMKSFPLFHLFYFENIPS